MKITNRMFTLEIKRGEKKASSEAPKRAKREAKDTASIESVIKDKKFVRNGALQLMSKLGKRAMNVNNSKVYLPFAEQNRKLLGGSKSSQVSFKEAVGLLEKGQTIVLKPFNWKKVTYGAVDRWRQDINVCKGYELAPYQPGDWEENPLPEIEIRNLEDLRKQMGKAPSPEKTPHAKEILQEWEQKKQAANNGKGGHLVMTPMIKGKGRMKKIGYAEAYKLLGEQSVFFKPELYYGDGGHYEEKDGYSYKEGAINYHPDTESFYWHLKECGNKISVNSLGKFGNKGTSVKPIEVNNSEDLKFLYRMLPGK